MQSGMQSERDAAESMLCSHPLESIDWPDNYWPPSTLVLNSVASQALGALGQLCVAGGVPLWYEPTSVPKAGRLWDAAAQPALAAGTLPLP